VITATGEYALRAAVCLAQRFGKAITTSEIAKITKVPPGYLSKILQAMARRRLIDSRRGPGGGFHLARDPRDVSVLDVLESVDAPFDRIRDCPLGIESHGNLCPVHRLVDDAIGQVEAAFRSTSLAELLKSTRGVAPLCEEHARGGCGTNRGARGRKHTASRKKES
jgi:Rrf2 family protein